MSEVNLPKTTAASEATTVDIDRASTNSASSGDLPPPSVSPVDRRRWWLRLVLQPMLLLICGAVLIVALGVAQRWGFISAGGGSSNHVSSGENSTRYICPMMCTPPQAHPGRCPVCAMELVPATSSSQNADSRAVHVDAAARRVANIRTAAVTSIAATRNVRVIGELRYDEGTLKTIAAYVDGRLERLYADYTGVVVKRGDHLALIYSPRLYSGQVELLLAKKSLAESRSSSLANVIQSAKDLYGSARQRLIELGMTPAQVEELERTGEANSRLHLCAPISGTVIDKLAVEGQYVKEGDAIYRLADLSTVWLMLRLFPEDAATIRYGQKVTAEVNSLPGRKWSGRVAFVDPNVEPKTRTVGVRVVIPNEDGLLRVGDYAKASIDVPVSATDTSVAYDAELANKWISPRHPHVIANAAGKCPICGVDLVPAAQFGFSDKPVADSETLAVPRDAVLMAGANSVVYVESNPGRFEIRNVVVGPTCGDQIAVRSGVTLGEKVAIRGNFLIDSQMQLAGNPSLIDPNRIKSSGDGHLLSPDIEEALAALTPEDRQLVDKQRICPVAEHTLGSMGPPRKVDVNGVPVFICCEGCREQLLSEPEKYLAKLASSQSQASTDVGMPEAPVIPDVPPIGAPQLIEPQGVDSGDEHKSAEAAILTRPSARQSVTPVEEVVR